MEKETLEEVAERLYEEETVNGYDISGYLQSAFLTGAKWQQEQSLKDMQEYAEFCIICDRKKMPLLLADDWYKHYKKE